MSILHLGRKHVGSTNIRASEIATIRGKHSGQIITAVRNAANRLQLVQWRIGPGGAITRVGDSGTQAGETSHIDLAPGSDLGSRVVSATRTGDGILRLISWDIDSAGPITRVKDSGNTGGAASHVKIVQVRESLLVTACRAGDGRLRLISWRLSENGSFTRLADSGDAAGAVTEVALLRLPTAEGRVNHLVTPVVTASGVLKVIHWTLSFDGAVLTRAGDSAGLVSGAREVRGVIAPNDPSGFVIGYQTATITSQLISCRVAPEGHVQRLADSGTQAGQTTVNSLAVLSDGIVSAGRTDTGQLQLIAWSLDADGRLVRRLDSGFQVHDNHLVTLVANPNAAGLRLVTVGRNDADALELTTWGQAVVRVHVKVLEPPTRSVETHVANMKEVFGSVGIGVDHVSTETLDLGEAFDTIDVGSCRGGTDSTDDQAELFQHRAHAGPNDVVVYIVRALDPVMVGCAAHPEGRPGVVVASFANEWAIAHEVGHVLGLGHVDDTDRLMTGNGTVRLTNPPPDLIPAEGAEMLGSPFTL